MSSSTTLSASDPSSSSLVHSVPYMLSERTMAGQIIRRHATPDAIFDGDHMRVLRRFVYDPSIGTRDAILGEGDMVDAPGDAPGTRANRMKGSLSGLIIARHGTDQYVFTPGDIGALRWWFKEMERAGVSLDE